MFRSARLREFKQVWLPIIAVASIGLVAAILLIVLAVQRIAGTPVERFVAVNDESETPISKVTADETVATVDPIPVTPTPQPVPAPKPAPKPRPQPQTQPSPKASVVISSDGCTITATGAAGLTLYVHSYNDSKGGESTFVIPTNGTLTERTSGIGGMTVEAKILDGSSSAVAEATGVIAPSKCWDW